MDCSSKSATSQFCLRLRIARAATMVLLGALCGLTTSCCLFQCAPRCPDHVDFSQKLPNLDGCDRTHLVAFLKADVDYEVSDPNHLAAFVSDDNFTTATKARVDNWIVVLNLINNKSSPAAQQQGFCKLFAEDLASFEKKTSPEMHDFRAPAARGFSAFMRGVEQNP